MNINIVLLFMSVFVGSFGVPTSQPHPGDSDLGIIGGDVAAEGSAPYMVALFFIPKTFYCSGSLITTRTVLTAGQCIDNHEDRFLKYIRGHVGSNKLWSSDGQTFAFDRYILYGNKTKHDIGLLITATKVVLSKLVKPISLDYNVVPGGKRTRSNGWGEIDYKKETPTDILMELYTETVDEKTCTEKMKKSPSPDIYDVETTICAFNATNHGLCYGDSGSPLVLLDESGAPKAQIGLAVRGIPCAKGYPDIFTKISYYQDWLKKNIIE